MRLRADDLVLRTGSTTARATRVPIFPVIFCRFPVIAHKFPCYWTRGLKRQKSQKGP